MHAAFPRYRVLAIHTTDDERNPPETGVLQAVMQRVPKGLLPTPAGAGLPKNPPTK